MKKKLGVRYHHTHIPRNSLKGMIITSNNYPEDYYLHTGNRNEPQGGFRKQVITDRDVKALRRRPVFVEVLSTLSSKIVSGDCASSEESQESTNDDDTDDDELNPSDGNSAVAANRGALSMDDPFTSQEPAGKDG